MNKLIAVTVVSLVSATLSAGGQIDPSNSRPTQDSQLQTISLLSQGEMLTVWGGSDECGCKAETGACDGEITCDPLIGDRSVQVVYSYNGYATCLDVENKVIDCTVLGVVLCTTTKIYDEPNCEGNVVSTIFDYHSGATCEETVH